jgi:regulator of cell morphogenesis and NO signaling
MSQSFEQTTVGEIVARDFRTAGVFEKFGIDFCCGGQRSLADACQAAAVDPVNVGRALEAIPPPDHETDNHVMRWPAARLIDHIVDTHHAYVRSALPTICAHLAKLVDVHGSRHPELRRIAAAFEEVNRDMRQHMKKEECVLFPYIRELAAGNDAPFSSPFGTVENPIRMMRREHQQAGDELRLIRTLANDYVAPADGCTTYRVTFAELAQFEQDLHRHVHLENNVLFPKAIELERRLCGA